MKHSRSARHLFARLGLVAGLSLSAVVLLALTIAVSAGALAAQSIAIPDPQSSSTLESWQHVGLSAPDSPAAATADAATQPGHLATSSGAAPSKSSRQFSQQVSSRHLSPSEAVRRAWQRARKAGAYRFTTDLVQFLYPAASLANAGSTPQREELYAAGDVDLDARGMHLKLWQGGGSVAGAGDGAELRVENGKAYLRRLSGGSGGAWQETSDISSNFAPDSDALGFLGRIKNVQGAQVVEGSPLVSERYTFEIDGPALARYMRDQLEAQLTSQAKLPHGVTLETPQQYRDATGGGELWLDASGLPLRLRVHVVYPKARNGQHVEADVKSDFSGYPVQQAAAPALFDRPIDWAKATLIPVQHPAAWSAGGRLLGVLALGALALLVLARPRRRRKLYAAVVVTVIVSMVLVPLMQSQQILAFDAGLAAQRAEQEEQQRAQDAIREAQAEQATPTFDPHSDPLAARPPAPQGGRRPVRLL